jgi:hypothetical protein
VWLYSLLPVAVSLRPELAGTACIYLRTSVDAVTMPPKTEDSVSLAQVKDVLENHPPTALLRYCYSLFIIYA